MDNILAERFNLPETFSHEGWSIRYLLRTPDTASSTIVFVHGTAWSSAVFRPISDSLLSTGLYNILLYDLPGYGQSQIHAGQEEGDTSVKAQGEALAALLMYLKVDKPHVVAHDIAGMVSMRAHLLHGAEYASLCMLDTNCVLPWGDGLYKLVRDNPAVFESLPPGVFEGALRAVIESARVPGEGLGASWTDILAAPWLGGEEQQKSFVRQIRQADDRHTAELEEGNQYAKVRCDVKILWGEEDQWIPLEKMEKLRDMLGPRMKAFVKVPRAGHLVILDQPERVTLEICRWLEMGR
jgi:pimeloyl-ACP methyl ester carboxylesterase